MGKEAAAAAAAALRFCCLVAPFLFFHLAHAQDTCSEISFSNRSFAVCNDLSALGAQLFWTYFPDNGTMEMAFRAQPSESGGYVAWGLNPEGSGMAGTEALVALQNSTNGVMWSYTNHIETKSGPDMSPERLPNVGVNDLSAEINEGHIIIYATVTLPENRTTIQHVWQVGSVSGGLPVSHSFGGENLQSLGDIDFLTGASTTPGIAKSKKVHGLLNGIAWGILMPIGVIFARYVKVFADPAWFYLHIVCQCTAYGIGVAGVATGIKLGNDSDGITHTAHRGIGIALLCMATLQVFALLLRPNKDHKYRIFWNIYHRGIGYAVIILSAVNIFKGFDILDTYDNWKNGYIGVLCGLGGIALVLEVVTWIVVLRRKREEKPHYGNGGSNGYSATRAV